MKAAAAGTTVFKKRIFGLSLLFVLLTSVFLCIYALWNYHGNTTPVQSRIERSNSLAGERSQSSNAGAQRPQGPVPHSGTARRGAPSGGPLWGGAKSGGTSYALPLILYSVLFLCVSAAAYGLLTEKKIQIRPGRGKWLMLALLCTGLLLRIASATLMEGHPFDLNTFKNWATAALLQIAGVFTFSARMHERYLFPAVALSLLAFLYLRDKRLLLLAAGFSATVYLNTHSVLFGTLNGINSASYGPVLISTSLLNVLLFVYLVKVLADIAVRKRTYLWEWKNRAGVLHIEKSGIHMCLVLQEAVKNLGALFCGPLFVHYMRRSKTYRAPFFTASHRISFLPAAQTAGHF
ncbi:MAG: hypothetical protein QHH06_14835 [Clostridiales bacterium]|jgi:hypothetical protein|nr:hypothetical protein [Eubacteriales bacterium]MDH7567714.1 hypothetical protein [Clostridiales bacterium]